MGALENVFGVESVLLKEHARHSYFGVISTISLENNAWFNSFVNDRLQGETRFIFKRSTEFSAASNLR